MNDTPKLHDRLAVVEDHLVAEYVAKRLGGFAPFYAALSVTVVSHLRRQGRES